MFFKACILLLFFIISTTHVSAQLKDIEAAERELEKIYENLKLVGGRKEILLHNLGIAPEKQLINGIFKSSPEALKIMDEVHNLNVNELDPLINQRARVYSEITNLWRTDETLLDLRTELVAGNFSYEEIKLMLKRNQKYLNLSLSEENILKMERDLMKGDITLLEKEQKELKRALLKATGENKIIIQEKYDLTTRSLKTAENIQRKTKVLEGNIDRIISEVNAKINVLNSELKLMIPESGKVNQASYEKLPKGYLERKRLAGVLFAEDMIYEKLVGIKPPNQGVVLTHPAFNNHSKQAPVLEDAYEAVKKNLIDLISPKDPSKITDILERFGGDKFGANMSDPQLILLFEEAKSLNSKQQGVRGLGEYMKAWKVYEADRAKAGITPASFLGSKPPAIPKNKPPVVAPKKPIIRRLFR